MYYLSENVVTDAKCNRNQSVTNTTTYNVKNNMELVTGYALMRDTRHDDIFDVGTDILDIAMRMFTVLARIQRKNTRGASLSIPFASWETACISHGLTPVQFLKARDYCAALHVYKEKEGDVVMDVRYVGLKEED